MHINKTNYFTEINKIGIRNLTPTLAQGHTMIEKITKNGESWDVASPTLETVIENQLKLFNAFAAKKSNEFIQSHIIVAKPEPLKESSFPVSKGDIVWDSKLKSTAKVTKIAKPAKVSALKDVPFVMHLDYPNGKKSINMPMGERFTLNLPDEPEIENEPNENTKLEKKKTPRSKIQKAVTARASVKKSPKVASNKKQSGREIKPPVTVKKFSLELQHIKRYLNMEGKNVSTKSILSLSKAVSKAFAEESYINHKELLKSIDKKLESACKELERTGQDSVNVNLTPEFKSNCKDIIGSAKVRYRAEYLAGTHKDCDCEKKK